jgi:hypothetical protein
MSTYYVYYDKGNKELYRIITTYPVLRCLLWNLITDIYTSYDHAARTINLVERASWLIEDVPLNTINSEDFGIRDECLT